MNRINDAAATADDSVGTGDAARLDGLSGEGATARQRGRRGKGRNLGPMQDQDKGQDGVLRRGAAAGAGRRKLIQKLERTVGREIAAIDARLKRLGAAGDAGEEDGRAVDHERNARALATLARTLRELAAIDRADAEGQDDDDDFPRDTETLRDNLARRLERLSRAGATEPFSG